MRLYYDFEFLDDSATVEPISLGMIRDDGAELYWVNTQFGWDDVELWGGLPHVDSQLRWLADNVKPVLYAVSPDTMLRADPTEAAEAVRAFMQGVDQLWGYFSAYDHVCLAQMSGPMIKWPHKVPPCTYDLRQLMFHRGLKKSDLPPEPEVKHNALVDARWIKQAVQFASGQ